MGKHKRKLTELKSTGPIMRHVIRVTLGECVVKDPNFEVSVDKLENNYDLYQLVNAPDRIRNGDLIVDRKQSTCQYKSEYETLTKDKKTVDQELQNIKTRRELSDAIAFFGTEYILPVLKDRYPDDSNVQEFKYWSNCAQRLNNRQDLETDMYEILSSSYGIEWNIWNDLTNFVKSRNRLIHPKHLTLSSALKYLEDNVPHINNLQDLYTPNYENAFHTLRTVLSDIYQKVSSPPPSDDTLLADSYIPFD